jgi:hypothetical protein
MMAEQTRRNILAKQHHTPPNRSIRFFSSVRSAAVSCRNGCTTGGEFFLSADDAPRVPDAPAEDADDDGGGDCMGEGAGPVRGPLEKLPEEAAAVIA